MYEFPLIQLAEVDPEGATLTVPLRLSNRMRLPDANPGRDALGLADLQPTARQASYRRPHANPTAALTPTAAVAALEPNAASPSTIPAVTR